jgi:uncharacterized membrane protein (DUF2068 family)
VDWSLLDCGRSGHLTYAPAEADVRRQLRAQAESGEAWRCLRCGAYVTGEPVMSGPAAAAPQVRRGVQIRSALILRIFAVERFLRALVVGALAFGVWRFEYARESIEQAFNRELPLLRNLFRQLGYNIDHSKLVGLFNRALTLSPVTIKLLAIGLACYAAIEVVEGVGLWVGKRWGEYFAMVATSVGLPFEIYDLASKISTIGLVLFAINLTLVLYLVITKRLFGVRGGKRAYDARLRSESIMDAAIAAAAASRPADPPPPEAPTPEAQPKAPTPDAQPEASTPEAQSEDPAPGARPDSSVPDARPDNSAPGAQPDNSASGAQPEGPAPDGPAPDGSAPDARPDGPAPDAQPDGSAPDHPVPHHRAPTEPDSARAAP